MNITKTREPASAKQIEVEETSEPEVEQLEQNEPVDPLVKIDSYTFRVLGGVPQKIDPITKPSKTNEMVTVRFSNSQCLTCGLDTVYQENDQRAAAVTLFPCGHSYHSLCCLQWINGRCPVCRNVPLKQVRSTVPQKPFAETILSLERDRPKVVSPVICEFLTFDQKCAVLGIDAMSKLGMTESKLKNVEIDMGKLVENHITVEFLFEQGIAFDQIYWRLGAKTIEDLVRLKFRNSDFRHKKCELMVLVDLYRLNHDELARVFGITLQDYIAKKYTVSELSRFGWTMSSLIEEGMTAEQFCKIIKFSSRDRSDTAPKVKKLLGFNASHISKLSLTCRVFACGLGWSFSEVKAQFALDSETCQLLKLSEAGFSTALKNYKLAQEKKKKEEDEKSWISRLFG
jgi:hypothetical protein